MAVSNYSTDPDLNTTISGINIAEGCPPSGINNAIRQLMADVRAESDSQNKTLSKAMTGATASAAGKAGLVPAPAKGSQERPLRGDGTWGDTLDCAVTRLYSEYLDSGMEDTTEWWKSQGNSICSINIEGLINNQPNRYGTVINTVTGSEIQQFFIVQPDGEIYKRGANSVGWNGSADDDGTWKRISNSMPVGAVYVQFPSQSAPADLFGGTWSNVSSSYAGCFFRAEGGSAVAFNGAVQADAAPDIQGTATAVETYKTRKSTGAFGYTGSLNNNQISGGSEFGSATLIFKASAYNGKYGDASEFRPRNQTVRIWQRTA